jgi:Transposase DDE domain
MRQGQFTISAKSVCHCAVQWLVRALQWPVEQARVTPEVVVQLLVRAAAQMRSLSAIVKEATAVPSLETIRQTLAAWLPGDPCELLPATTRALHGRLPRSLRGRLRTMAIDLHLRPYYGSKNTCGIYRGQPKASTKTFFAYATVMVLRRGQTFTVGLTHVVNGEEQTAIIERLLAQVQAAGLQIRRLLLDRGFYAATTIQWLQERSIAFVMPMIRRGKSGKSKAQCTGTAQFFGRGRRGWDQYTWTARPRRGGRKQPGVTVTVDVAMVSRTQYCAKKNQSGGPLVFACHGVAAAPQQVAQWYRKRFRIETSYRQLGQGLAATCSKNPVYRLLLAAIALVLRNLWVWLHYRYLAEHRGGALHLRLDRLRVLKIMTWLIAILNQLLCLRPQAITIVPQLTNAVSGRR